VGQLSSSIHLKVAHDSESRTFPISSALKALYQVAIMAGRGGEGAINRKEQPPFLLLLHFREGGSFSYVARAHIPDHSYMTTDKAGI
jgi:hypothetical protein